MPNLTMVRRVLAAAQVPEFPGPPPAFFLAANKITGLNDGDAVGTWSDLSGNGRDFVQATAGSKPTFKTNIKNGLPAVQFPTATKFLKCTTLTSTRDFTFFTVVQSSSANLQSAFYRGGTTNGIGHLRLSNTRDRLSQSWNAGAFLNSTNGLMTDGVAEAWTWRRNNTGPLLELRLNGVGQTITNSTAAMGLPGTNAVVGCYDAVGTPQFGWEGYIFEVIGYDSVLSDGVCSIIEAYLIKKYAL